MNWKLEAAQGFPNGEPRGQSGPAQRFTKHVPVIGGRTECRDEPSSQEPCGVWWVLIGVDKEGLRREWGVMRHSHI